MATVDKSVKSISIRHRNTRFGNDSSRSTLPDKSNEIQCIWAIVDCGATSIFMTPRLFKPLGISYKAAHIVLATGPGNPAAVRVWTAKTGRFGSRTVKKLDPQTLGGPNPDPYPSTRGFRRVWLDLSVPISGSAFRVSYLWSHSDMRLLIVKY